ncbi:MAG TPA: PBSX family phage terminase large subunit [Rhodospirillales bacterium]|nr:PBSX family phage terminase large subunit [Rhodospirillales bacterium]
MAQGAILDIPTARVFQPLLKPARYKGAKGGRGSAKSWQFAGMAVEAAYCEKVDIVCIREVQLTLDQSVKKLIEQTIQRYGLGQHFDVQRDKIVSQRGGVMIFRGMQDFNAENIKSLEGFDIAWVEEAQTITQRSLDLLRPTIRKDGSELWFSWNPNSETDPIEQFFAPENRPKDSVVIEAHYWDNPWFPAVLRDEMQHDRKRDPDKYQHIWCGAYRKMSEALVFKNWRVEEFDAPAGSTFRLGADWGYANDPTVLVRCYLAGDREIRVDYCEGMVGCEIDQTPDLFDRVPDSRKWFITADSSRPETVSYMRSHGFPRINSAMKGAGSVEEGVEFLKSYDLVVHPRCEGLINELRSYTWKVDRLTGQVLPVLEDKNNHYIDALRYACEGVRKGQKAKPASASRPVVHRPVAGGWMRS